MYYYETNQCFLVVLCSDNSIHFRLWLGTWAEHGTIALNTYIII